MKLSLEIEGNFSKLGFEGKDENDRGKRLKMVKEAIEILKYQKNELMGKDSPNYKM